MIKIPEELKFPVFLCAKKVTPLHQNNFQNLKVIPLHQNNFTNQKSSVTI